MINVSKEFQKLMNERTDFKQYAEMTLADGTEIFLTKSDFSIQNNSVVDGAESSGIPLGVAVCRYIQIEIDNRDERYSDIDFFGAKIRLYLTFELSETEEKIEYGTFTVLEPETYGETIIITALDDMHKANKDYTTNLVFPATLRDILVDACDTLYIQIGTTSFLNDDFVVSEKPTGFTFRQLFGYISMIAAGNIRIDRTGRLQVLTYNFCVIDNIQDKIDGGNYIKRNDPIWVDGGNFTDYSTGDDADGGWFLDRKNYHILSNWKNVKVETDDVVITGISTNSLNSDGEEVELLSGIEGYVLKIENPLIVGKEQSVIDSIGNVMIGGKMRPFSGDLVANPTIEFMDFAAVSDRKGNVYATILTDVNFNFFGFTVLKNSAAPALRNSSVTYSAATETLVAAKKLVEKEKTARETAIAQLAKDLKESSGLFMTEEEQSDGSSIYYMHDKPTLEESMIIWKLTALAFGISTDGGKTYPYGFTVNGDVITRLLYAEGINADYIKTGSIKVSDDDGNIVFLADYDNKQVIIKSNIFDLESNNLKISSDGYVKTFDKDGNSTTLQSGELLFKNSSNTDVGRIYVNEDSLNITAGIWDPVFEKFTMNRNLKLSGGNVNIRAQAIEGEFYLGNINFSCGSLSVNGILGSDQNIQIPVQNILPTTVVSGVTTIPVQVVTGLQNIAGILTPVFGTVYSLTNVQTTSVSTVSENPKTLNFSKGILTS